MSYSGRGNNRSSSGNRAGQHFSTRGQRLGGGGGGGGGHPHQTRSQATAPHGFHDAMHHLADTMADLDSMLGSRPQSQSMRGAFGPGFPFDDADGVPGFDALRIGMGAAFDSACEGAFSHPIFSGNDIAHEPRANRPGSSFGANFPFGPSSHTPIHVGGIGRGEDLPFHAHPTPPRRAGSEQRINNFIARNTEPLTAANTTSTTNTDCPVCMENAAAHPCVKIKGIAGCEHMIGRDCLKEFLKQRPDDEKTCPLCRAVWLAENGVWQDSDPWSERIAQANLGHRFARW